MPGEDEVERAAQAVQVGPPIDRMAVERLFGGQIVGRAEHVFVVCDRQRGFLAVGEFGQSQVQHFDRALGVDQQIGRLDVAVDQAGFVGMFQSVGRLGDVVGGQIVVQRPSSLTMFCRSRPSTYSMTR